VITKPSRKTSRKFYGVGVHILIVFALIIIPVMAWVPMNIRMKILHRGYKIIEGEER